MPLLLVSIYHVAEWLRVTVLLSVTLLGVNWSVVWYATSFVSVYGLIAYAFTHMAYFDATGVAC